MKTPLRAALVVAAAVATLAFANGALAANTGSIAVWHDPMVLAGSKSTTIHVKLPETSDPVAVVNIFTAAGYGVTLGQAAGTTIGTVEATALSRDNNLTLPLSGTVTTDDPAKHTTDVCSPGSNAAVWNLNLSVAGQTLVVPLYVNPTSGAGQALGGHNLKICLPPPDVPVGTPGRAFQGAQLLDSRFTVNGIFTTPTSGGLVKWESLFTPYNPGKGTPNPAGTFEARALVPVPIILGIHSSYKKKTATWQLNGRLTEGGLAVPASTLVVVYKGTSSTVLRKVTTAKVNAAGNWSVSGKLKPKKTTFFQINAVVGERDYTAQGCTNPVTAVAPAGCVSATLSPWNVKSAVVRVKP
jgi:hypothetical protein